MLFKQWIYRAGFIFMLACGMLAFAIGPAGADDDLKNLDPQALVVAIDNNMWSTTKYVEGRLIVDNGRRERTLEMNTWMEGITKSFSHYKSPPRERGTKMLKIERKLWLYTPQTDRTILIAGHLLRQSMMGSDLSYEDMLEDEKLSEAYIPEIDKVEAFEGVTSLVLDLTAKDPAKTYQSRKVWTDPVRKIVLREQRFAKSGKLLKMIDFKDYRPIGDRLFPRRMVFRDMLKDGTKTTYMFDHIEFDVDIPPKYFSKRILKR
ncbi:outer membrane lipoprotein-sorting protein [Nitrospina watsonii]|uniref:Sigma E regulatory protein, MucB/RseB n=1 Tax=Nitrospina watsonii TaxID=1323948 RepID=A0ABN8W0Y9_9BACT|nr:outer membrane lipoprotein-sorting protein [Nitrospina watsonii]CAI2718524.1 Putative sigma E regulatory protein, MucB/RseB [Nitrospina watsonii]